MIIKAIAFNTFKETVRDKILYNILLFALGFAILSGIVSQWSLNQEEKVLQDFGLTIISVFGILIAVFIGIGLLYKELDNRTIYTVLSKPISRGQFLWGKYFGLVLTLAVNFTLMAAGLLSVLWLFTGLLKVTLLIAVGMIFFQMSILVAVSLFFAVYASPVVSVVLTLFVFLAGNFSADITMLNPGIENPLFMGILNVLFYVIPNFSLLNINSQIVHNLPLNYIELIWSIVYSIAYSSVLLVFGSMIFNRKNLK